MHAYIYTETKNVIDEIPSKYKTTFNRKIILNFKLKKKKVKNKATFLSLLQRPFIFFLLKFTFCIKILFANKKKTVKK